MRWLRHLFAGDPVARHFPPATLDAIQRAIAAGERGHRGEVCFAVEGALPWRLVLSRLSVRERAAEVFAHLRVWDTRENTGVLIYVLLAEHAIEIVADRGIAARIGDAEWQALCACIREHFAAGAFEAGAIAAVERANVLLAAQFPAEPDDNPDELPDRPVVL
ncbi:MAG TPA: TPM domain-containing protein [Dokdonella sp.]|uniref:TPM domain-containing protein n=1 Tax=Dokdonella sp. TaxID=2291710 RepID=UPI002BD00BDE|nr:TPM domain-containing protein [Dokdonella sp.]HUD41442.1 TPM domain-containing protein [Dokdonella sp.]